MNELNPAGLALNQASTTKSASAGAAADLSSNFDTFLTLLTEQLQNQDPLNPMQSEEFVNQLVQFASVEQLIGSTQSLENILALQAADTRMASADFIGKEVTVSGTSAALKGGEARWQYGLGRQAESVEISVADADGRIVRTYKNQPSAQGPHDFVWDGRDNSGNALAEGVYRIEVVAKDADGARMEVPVRVTGRVTGVDLSGEDPLVEIGLLRAPAASVIGVREGATA